ncbi:pyruvate kinase [Buchnera aphidicola (Cinara tujafilina)]|uniref:Pyruvate kinase n=1 Tax=Buchnera aphidicola (Cinara tujafilina) TaxID=261317 RepID=F7WZD1_9GAMM|nr:pyruvate kinase [Buchnera aphidicola]AEH39793.1 pyruvate kinase [Buchnera aphidicola (Cinara tujafilina)]
MHNDICRTKIVSTLGPSTNSKSIIKKLIQSGSKILRLNFSHGTAEEHKKRVKSIREITKKYGYSVAIIGDLQGPKIRISSFKNKKIFLDVGDTFLLDHTIPKFHGNKKKVGISYKNLPFEVVVNDLILLDDGKIQLKVLEIDNNKIYTKVVIGGTLTDNKGLNKLGGGLSAKALTKKDKEDIKLASKLGIDYLAVSFPRSAADIQEARTLMKNAGSNAQIIAKIERAEAVMSDIVIKEIILAADAIMIARGDLGVEIGDDKLIGVQKHLIQLARQLNRTVITATQMMESMIDNPFPTRAEVMDVANAVIDGTDAVMLSAETASGHFPINTVQSVLKICQGAEKLPCMHISKHRLGLKFYNISETLAMSIMYAANHLKNVSAILIYTDSLDIALLTSRITSRIPIFYFSYCQKNLNLSTLYKGVIPIYIEKKQMELNNIDDAISIIKEKKGVQKKMIISLL